MKDVKIQSHSGFVAAMIGDDIEIGTRSLDAGLSNLGRVRGVATEDNVPGEGRSAVY